MVRDTLYVGCYKLIINSKIEVMEYYYKTELIIALLFVAYVLFRINPVLFFAFLAVITAIYLLIRFVLIPFFSKLREKAEAAGRRRAALKEAKIYLAPYNDIWSNLRLSNTKCSLCLGVDGVTISVIEKGHPYRRLRVVSSNVYDYRDLWDMFCIGFSHNSTYDSLKKDCELYKLKYQEFVDKVNKDIDERKKINAAQYNGSNKIDVNNCSEFELTELPGISIVLAKKVIQKREEIGGFKNIEDFFLFIKLKSHLREQIQEKVFVKPMKILHKKVEKFKERKIDL